MHENPRKAPSDRRRAAGFDAGYRQCQRDAIAACRAYASERLASLDPLELIEEFRAPFDTQTPNHVRSSAASDCADAIRKLKPHSGARAPKEK